MNDYRVTDSIEHNKRVFQEIFSDTARRITGHPRSAGWSERSWISARRRSTSF